MSDQQYCIASCDKALRAAGIPISGVSGVGPDDPDLQIDYEPNSSPTEEQQQQAMQIARDPANWQFPLIPDPLGLAEDISNSFSGAANTAIRLQLASFMGMASIYPSNPTLVKQAWADLIVAVGSQNNPNGWLSIDAQTTIEKLAQQRNMPLND